MVLGECDQLNRQSIVARHRLVLARDSTGKVHGELPAYAPKQWTREQLEVSRDELTKSIEMRRRSSSGMAKIPLIACVFPRRRHYSGGSTNGWKTLDDDTDLRDR
jgi:hypothetical protein